MENDTTFESLAISPDYKTTANNQIDMDYLKKHGILVETTMDNDKPIQLATPSLNGPVKYSDSNMDFNEPFRNVKCQYQKTSDTPHPGPFPDLLPEKKKKIKIVWTSMHNCIRVIKLSKALQATGRYEIHGVAAQVSYGTEGFDSFSFYHNTVQFENLIKMIPADIYIHSNEPNWQANRIRDIKPNARIILDGHDFDSVRMNALPIDEMRAFTSCNGFLFVSKEVREFITKLHKDQVGEKPTAVIEHYCNEEWHKQPQAPTNQRSGLVYEGGMSSPPYKDNINVFWHLYPVFKQLVEQGHEVHLAPGNQDAVNPYSNLGAHVYQPQTYPKLMAMLRSKKFGLVTFNNPRLDQKQVNITLTNKHFEYIACGLPVIVCGAPATAAWVKKTGEGICFDRLEDITPAALDKAYPACKAVVDKLASEYTMEKHIHKLEELISKVLEN